MKLSSDTQHAHFKTYFTLKYDMLETFCLSFTIIHVAIYKTRNCRGRKIFGIMKKKKTKILFELNKRRFIKYSVMFFMLTGAWIVGFTNIISVRVTDVFTIIRNS